MKQNKNQKIEEENWISINKIKSNTQAMEMKYRKRVEGVSKNDRIWNVETRIRLEISSLQNRKPTIMLFWTS